MMNHPLKLLSLFAISSLVFVSCSGGEPEYTGQTEILKWQHGKRAAISLTYDDGSMNQFRVALPMMEERGFRGTFFINTGHIPGSQYKARFIGRPVEEIIKETGSIPTTPENLFERASAVGYLGFPGLMDAHTRAGAAVDAGNIERACRIIDEAYERVRKDRMHSPPVIPESGGSSYSGKERIDWNDVREFAGRGHEFASHTISHPRLAVLDEVNMRWELEKCREEILNQLGTDHTFSCECPYGTENERVMEIAYQIYPALRNRMPHPWLEELNRSSRKSPGATEKPYVQWQRGPLSHTSLAEMNGWIDTCLNHDHIWLVLVFHGVDGIGWEALEGDTLSSFFNTISSHNQAIWVAPFREVTRYLRERMSGNVETRVNGRLIQVQLTHTLDPELYPMPLTLKTYLPDRWEQISIRQNEEALSHHIGADSLGRFVQYQAHPNREPVLISALRE